MAQATLRRLVLEGPSAREGLPSGCKFLAMCLASHKRGWQIQITLPINLMFLHHLQGSSAIFLSVFHDDDVIAWAQQNLEWAIEKKLLHVSASCGRAQPVAHSLHTTTLPGIETPYYHASAAKNTSHKTAIAAMAAVGESNSIKEVLLCNLDADNMFMPAWPQTLVSSAVMNQCLHDDGPCPAITAGSDALTGRLAYWAQDFMSIGGYDQESDTAGSGSLVCILKLVFCFAVEVSN